MLLSTAARASSKNKKTSLCVYRMHSTIAVKNQIFHLLLEFGYGAFDALIRQLATSVILLWIGDLHPIQFSIKIGEFPIQTLNLPILFSCAEIDASARRPQIQRVAQLANTRQELAAIGESSLFCELRTMAL
jgi:hypothetical protein